MYAIPTSIFVKDSQYTIRGRGDYRIVLDCFACLSDADLNEQERLYSMLIIFYEDFNSLEDLFACEQDTLQELVNQMYKFFSCGEDGSGGVQLPYKVIDWEKDDHLICSAVNKVAHMEVRSVEYMHWWTFMGYFMEIGESTFSTVVGIRSKMMKGKKLEKYEKDFRNSNPQYFNWDTRTAQQLKDEELFRELWQD